MGNICHLVFGVAGIRTHSTLENKSYTITTRPTNQPTLLLSIRFTITDQNRKKVLENSYILLDWIEEREVPNH